MLASGQGEGLLETALRLASVRGRLLEGRLALETQQLPS
jgi:hypothetical protein